MFEFHIDRIIASTNSFTTMISAHEDLNDGGNLPHYVFFLYFVILLLTALLNYVKPSDLFQQYKLIQLV